MVKMDPQKLVHPGTNFSINKDPPELILLQNMDSLWKIWTTSYRWKNVDPEYISLAKLGPVAYPWRFLRFLETTHTCQFSSMQYTVVSFPAARKSHLPCTLCKVCDECMFRTLRGAAEAYSWKAVIHFSRYVTVNSTNVLRSHWFSFV